MVRIQATGSLRRLKQCLLPVHVDLLVFPAPCHFLCLFSLPHDPRFGTAGGLQFIGVGLRWRFLNCGATVAFLVSTAVICFELEVVRLRRFGTSPQPPVPVLPQVYCPLPLFVF